MYEDPNKPDPYRQLWVARSCDGRLVMGATWGDASPWWFNSKSDNQFSYKDSFMALDIEFKLDTNQQAKTLIHSLEGMTSPLERVGPLTKDYPECIPAVNR